MKPCKIYDGRINREGYGVGPQRKLAHRLAYCAHHGLPLNAIKGLMVRHKCDVRSCIEPSHLETGTHDDNMRDMRERSRSNKGERHGMARLSNAEAAALRAEYVPYSRIHGAAALASRYGLSTRHVRRIVNDQRRQSCTDSLSH